MEFKTLTALSANYGGWRRERDIKYIVVHYTGNDGDRAMNNARYYRTNAVKTSAHYFVDDDGVVQSVPDVRIAWAVGGKKYKSCSWSGGGKMYGKITNTNSISVEMCDTHRDGHFAASKKTRQNAIELIRLLMERYHIPIKNVYRHFDVTGKYCPAYLVGEKVWADFKREVMAVKKDNTPSPAHKAGVDWAVKNGIIRGDADGNLKLHSPVTREQLCTILFRMGGGPIGRG